MTDLPGLIRRAGLRGLARHLGVTPPTVSRWADGTHQPGLAIAARLAELAAMSDDELRAIGLGRRRPGRAPTPQPADWRAEIQIPHRGVTALVVDGTWVDGAWICCARDAAGTEWTVELRGSLAPTATIAAEKAAEMILRGEIS